MKPVLAFCFLLLLSCSNKKEDVSMEGAYNMILQKASTGTSDSIYKRNQLKIYTEDHMMFANINPPDSISGFGIATYSTKGDTVTENIIFGAYDTSRNANPRTFNLGIEKSDVGFTQTIPTIQMETGSVTLVEIYDQVGTADNTSPLDGAWKQTAAYHIVHDDTTTGSLTQYKTFGSGHFIWGHTYSDSVSHTAVGFGKFVLNDNKLKETVQASTYHDVRGRDVNIEVEFDGKDKYKQTTINPDGSKGVELYERLKKD